MSIFYRPGNPDTGIMWDTWLYWLDGTYYLFYLARSGENWDNTSLATSNDGIHWTESGPIYRMSEDTTWMGTGSTWKSPVSERSAFQINYSEWKGERQTIFFAESDDLVQWQKPIPPIQFVQDERWYEPLGRWDCIWTVPRDDGGLYGYWTATPKYGTRGRFGFGRSDDGINWAALKPPEVKGVDEGEVGAVEKIGAKFYMMFGSHGEMITLVADAPDGPFLVTKKNRVLLAGDTYFSRFFSSPDGLLVNHHSMVRGDRSRIHLGLLKRALIDDEGTMRLGWWDGNNLLKGDRTEFDIKPGDSTPSPVSFIENIPVDSVANGVIVEGEIALPPDAFSRGRGLFVEFEPGKGMAALFDERGRAELSILNEDGTGREVRWRVDREKPFSVAVSIGWRLVLEDRLCEFYLDDILIECFSLPATATGRVGLIDGGVRGSIQALKMWR